MGFFSALGSVAKVVAPIIPGVSSLFSSKKDNEQQISSAYQANQTNIAEAQKSRDWSERMFKNRHTYEVEDLKRAGLNPILSAHGGGSVPSSAQATVQNPRQNQTERKIAVANALSQLAVTAQQAEKLRSESTNIKLDSAKKVVQSKTWQKAGGKLLNSAFAVIDKSIDGWSMIPKYLKDEIGYIKNKL
jgi:uncharacterized protein YoxC